jgi:hypothetical protein
MQKTIQNSINTTHAITLNASRASSASCASQASPAAQASQNPSYPSNRSNALSLSSSAFYSSLNLRVVINLHKNLLIRGPARVSKIDPVSGSNLTLPYYVALVIPLLACLCSLMYSSTYCTSWATASRISFFFVLHGAARVMPRASLCVIMFQRWELSYGSAGSMLGAWRRRSSEP